MSWNYRVVCLPSEDSATNEQFVIAEVYYDPEGNPSGFAEAPPVSDTVTGLKEVLERMAKSLEAPILVPSDFR